MRPGTDAKPVAVTPVAQVVSTALAGTGPVRDLVVPVAVFSQDPFGELVEARDTRVVGLGRCRAAPPALYRTPAGSRPVRHGLLGLERELERVAGEVVGAQRDRRCQILTPRRRGLAGPAEDEIEVHVEPDRPSRRHGGCDVLRLVRPTERVQSGRRQRLRAEREARDAEGRPRLQPRAVERRRVRLDRRLHRAQVESVAERRPQARDLIRLQQARCTASDVERRDPRPPQTQALAPDLDVESFHIPRPKRAPRGGRREVTVRAPSSAERDVHIEA